VLSSLVIPVLTGKARAHASMSRIPDAQHKCCHAVSRPSEIGGGGQQPRADMRCKTAYPPHDLGTHGAGLRWGIPANPTAGDCSRRTQRVAPASYHDAGSPISPAHLHNAPHPCPLPFAHCHDCLCALGWTCVCAPDASSRPQSTGEQAPHRAAPQPLRELAVCCVRSCADCCVHARTPSSHPDGSGRDNRPHLPRPTPVPCRSDEASIRQPASLASPRFPMPSYRGPDGASCDGMSPSCDAFAWRV